MGVGPFDTVALYDYHTMKEVLNRDEFQGRHDSHTIRYRTGGESRGIGFNEGPDQKVHRRFMIRAMKDLSGGKSQMEQILVEEAERMTD